MGEERGVNMNSERKQIHNIRSGLIEGLLDCIEKARRAETRQDLEDTLKLMQEVEECLSCDIIEIIK
jgi:hypothetical protein